jgi:hypothetical protein
MLVLRILVIETMDVKMLKFPAMIMINVLMMIVISRPDVLIRKLYVMITMHALKTYALVLLVVHTQKSIVTMVTSVPMTFVINLTVAATLV